MNPQKIEWPGSKNKLKSLLDSEKYAETTHRESTTTTHNPREIIGASGRLRGNEMDLVGIRRPIRGTRWAFLRHLAGLRGRYWAASPDLWAFIGVSRQIRGN